MLDWEIFHVKVLVFSCVNAVAGKPNQVPLTSLLYEARNTEDFKTLVVSIELM